MAQVGSWKGDGSRLWRDCRGEACLARRVRSTRIAHIAIIHSQTSLSVIAGEVLYPPHLFCGRGTPRPYKALRRQGYKRDFTALTGRENVGFCTPQGVALG